eukprot:2827777-Amphidinium_carterae.1
MGGGGGPALDLRVLPLPLPFDWPLPDLLTQKRLLGWPSLGNPHTKHKAVLELGIDGKAWEVVESRLRLRPRSIPLSGVPMGWASSKFQ